MNIFTTVPLQVCFFNFNSNIFLLCISHNKESDLFLCRFHSSQVFITHVDTSPFPIKGCNSIHVPVPICSVLMTTKQWGFLCMLFKSPLWHICSGSVDNLLQPSYDIWPCQANTVTSVPPLSEGLPNAGLSLSLTAYEWGETFVMLHILWHRAQFSSSHQRYTPFNLLLRPAMGSGDLSVAKIHTQMHREHYPRHVMLI